MKLVTALALAAAVVLPPATALAARRPYQGEYIITPTNYHICLSNDGTWYSESVAGWHGWWTLVGKTLLLRGNQSSGYIDDAFNFTGNSDIGYTGDWQEWNDSGATLRAATAGMTWNDSACAPPPAAAPEDAPR